jgi:hypothetical protein
VEINGVIPVSSGPRILSNGVSVKRLVPLVGDASRTDKRKGVVLDGEVSRDFRRRDT